MRIESIKLVEISIYHMYITLLSSFNKIFIKFVYRKD